MGMTAARLDIVTVVSNETDAELARFGRGLGAAWNRLDPADRGIAIVVSSGASNRLLELAEATLGKATGTVPKPVVLGSNRGSAHAYNAGFAHTSAPMIALLDPDGSPADDLLERLLAALDARPDLAAASAHVVGFDAEPASSVWASEEANWVGAGATIYRREAFAAVGGFDELFAGYCEDMDFGHRVRAAGWSCLRVGGAVFRHRTHSEGSFRKFVVLTEYMLVWRHIHFSRAVTAKSWFTQIPIVLRSSRGDRAIALAGTATGLLAYLRHIPSCERRRA